MWKDSYKCAALETQYMPISCACYLYEMYDFGISLHSLAHNEKFLFISSIHRPFWITAYRSIIIDASFFSVSPPPRHLSFSLFHSSLSHSLPICLTHSSSFFVSSSSRPIAIHLPSLCLSLCSPYFTLSPSDTPITIHRRKCYLVVAHFFLHQPFTCQCIIDFSPNRMFFSHTSDTRYETCSCHYAFSTQSIFCWCWFLVKNHRLLHW